MFNKEKLYKPTKYDFFLAGLILIFSFFLLISSFKGLKTSKKKALIYKNGKLIKEIDLLSSKNKHNYFRVSNMIIEIKEGRVRVKESDCPQKICVRTGWIEKPSQTIICAPNKLLIEIAGGFSKKEYNAITY